MLVLPAVVLVIRFFNGLMPVSESPSPALNALGIVMELLAVVGLIGMGVRVLHSQTSGRGVWIFVLMVGIAAALGIFAIRLTGGPHVELPPRSSATSVELEGLPKQLHELIVSSSKLSEKLAAYSDEARIACMPSK